jgi:hypothetical protein
MICISGDFGYNVPEPSYTHMKFENSEFVWCDYALLLLYFSAYCETLALSSYRVVLNVRERQFAAVRNWG